jgi:hypothetical protein
LPDERVPEAVLARIWNEGWFSRELRTVDGRRVGVVYRGVWTHSNGPDFQDAMIEIDGRLLTGSIELHVRSSDWNNHGHQFNPAYDGVILHVALENDAAPCTGPSGLPLPTVELAQFLPAPVESFALAGYPRELGTPGSLACLPTLAGGRPSEIHNVLRREGWKRMQDKQVRFQQEMVVRPPSEVLYRGILDSLGLSSNREGMASVADTLPLSLAERIGVEHGRTGVVAALLGSGGFLPLPPAYETMIQVDSDAALELERAWHALETGYRLSAVPLSVWNLNRVRPLNHPVRRLASMGSILVSAAEIGLLAVVTGLIVDGSAGWDAWLTGVDPSIGASRRAQLIINTLAPFTAAYADLTDNASLAEATGMVWETLPGSVDDTVARKTLRQITGGRRFPVRSALEIQGLHQIGRNGCAGLRCFECPIAGLALTYEKANFID